MSVRHWITGGLLGLLLAASAAGLVWTRAGRPPGGAGPEQKAQAEQERLVDMQPLLTARGLAGLPIGPEEKAFAEQAVRLGNHSVNLAFTEALRRVAENPPTLTPELSSLSELKDKAAAAVESDQQLIKELARKLATAPETQKNRLEDQLDVAKAQLELDQGELEDAANDLEAAGGDPQARIQRLKAAYEALGKEAQAPAAGGPGRFSQASLLGRIADWNHERGKLPRLEQARGEALATAQGIEESRARFAEQVKKQAEAREMAKQSAVGFAKEGASMPGYSSRVTAKANLDSLGLFMSDQRILTDMGKRIADERELADLYGDWAGQVAAQAQAALHRVLVSSLVILAVLLGAFAAGLGMDRFFHRAGEENLRAGTLATVAKFGVRALGLLVVLFVVLGVPGQTTTILGLAGAGLTVALKDFIVAFFGWFVLMGRNGLRVGDWVEIKGVGGEVVEISLLRTVLLETGSWADAGHPTGRRVAFVNSFAIEGHFFNFSTSGQWMWDELRVLIPTGQDPYPVIDGIQKLVEHATEASARLAEQEWQAAARKYRVKAFSAVPGLQVVPTSSGIEIRVRYITRAHERHGTRQSLYQAVVELMHGKRPEGEGLDTPEGTG
jgi:small-conductance mechanosensitive channel